MRTTIYIGTDLVDQHEDESVDVVSSVLDITDITKNTGDYTKTFTVPASKSNNKLFKHYYDANIDNSFDARTKIGGRIELDGLPFKVGKWRLSKVSVKKGKPSSYTINFFGNLSSLKDTLGKDELTSLDLSAYDHDYTHENVNLGLQVGGLFSGDIIYNLLAKKRYVYSDDSSYVVPDEYTRNIAWGGDSDSGVFWDDLKPSIRLIKIIEAIEDEYTLANGYENPIVFSRDFFDTSEFTELFMWLSEDKEKPQGDTQIVDWFSATSSEVNTVTNVGTFTIEAGSRWDFECRISSAIFNNPKDVTVSMYVDGVKAQEISGSINTTGGGYELAITLESTITSNTLVDKDVYFEVNTNNTSIKAKWTYRKYSAASVLISENTAEKNGQFFTSEFVISNNFPKIKIIDFLKGLFNMFKLVVVPQDDGTLYVDTLKSYYSLGITYDVTKHIDFKSTEVSRGEILNKIDLKFQEPSTILNIQFEKNNRRGYGDEEITLKDDNDKILDGESLEFELPFEQVVYERLTDLATGDLTDVQYGAIIGEDLSPAGLKTHIFYNNISNTINSRIGFIEYTDDPTVFTKSQLNALINTPYHHYGVTSPNYSSIFKNEFSTWDGYSLDNNLYSLHYRDYVEDIFNIKKRNFKFTAQLPIHITTKLELNDTLYIKGNYYRIDKYSYNLLTGKTTLNLINNFDTNIGGLLALQDTIYTDYLAKTEVAQVTNLQSGAVTLVDNGFGTTWATTSTSGNNLSIILDEFTTTNGNIRSIIVRTTGTTTVDVYVYQTDKGYIPSFDFSMPTNSQNIALINLRT